MKAIFLLKGLVKTIPGIEYLYNFHKKAGGASNARYCYSVWLRHLIYAYRNGMKDLPKKLAELGPGDSLGVGLSALICGAEEYFAFDVVKYTNIEINLKIFDELVELFKNRASIPTDKEFALIKPDLTDYNFPSNILNEEHMKKMLSTERLERIRNAIKNLDKDIPGNMISYQAPWTDGSIIKKDYLDMILSQAVLEHVDDLNLTYKAMSEWLKPNGICSHDIDFKSHGSSNTWYGHWGYSDIEWKIVRGRKKYFINRKPYSYHIELLRKNRFKIICDLKTSSPVRANVKELAGNMKNFTEDDLRTTSVFVQAKKLT